MNLLKRILKVWKYGYKKCSIEKGIVMAWVAVDMDNTEYVYEEEPFRTEAGCWWSYLGVVRIPNGSIKKLIGRELTFVDEPVELK